MNMSRNVSADDDMATCGYIYLAGSCAFFLLLPVFLFVICFGFQHCKSPRSRSSTATHADVFTFNMAAFEVIGVLTFCVIIVGFHVKNRALVTLGEILNSLTMIGQTLLHILVCLERYLAVVHPVTYLRLKNNAAVIRNVSIAAVWLLSVAMASVNHVESLLVNLFTVVATDILSLALVSFFCASVLYVLTRPGPGERRHVDRMKRRAFYTVTAITAALMLKFVTLFVLFMAYMSGTFDATQLCLFEAATQWFNIPSSLVMPVLFLYRLVKQRNKAQATNP